MPYKDRQKQMKRDRKRAKIRWQDLNYRKWIKSYLKEYYKKNPEKFRKYREKQRIKRDFNIDDSKKYFYNVIKNPHKIKNKAIYYNDIRKNVLKRDNFKCQTCNISYCESINKYKISLCIHHKDKNRKNNNENNLITLCLSCHSRLHNGRNTKMKIKINKIRKLRDKGYTFKKIGDIYGVSRQRIHQVLSTY